DGSHARHPGALHALGVQPPPGKGKCRQRVATAVERRPGVQKCAESHVAGDPREGVEPRDPAHAPPARRPQSRATAHAAPKPLSMPTTVTPWGQLESMACCDQN